MQRVTGWLALAAVLVLLLAACGPEMETPTPGEEAASAPTQVGEQVEATDEPAAEPTEEVTDVVATDEVAEPKVPSSEAEDWHVLGSPDASVTIVEYSDFQ